MRGKNHQNQPVYGKEADSSLSRETEFLRVNGDNENNIFLFADNRKGLYTTVTGSRMLKVFTKNQDVTTNCTS